MITSVQQALKTVDEIRNFLTNLLISSEQAEYIKDLLKRGDWPLAVPEVYLCSDSEDDKFARAESILDFMFMASLKDKRLLDFGCGLGHLVVKAYDYGAKAVGYDLQSSSSFEWEKDGQYLLTTNLETLRAKSPFDIIILYDVLDHAERPLEALHQVRNLCHENTEVHIRCHPFRSRHGGHLYNKFNKAFVHLTFTEEELAEMGHSFDGHLQRLDCPIVDYHQWFNQSGFSIVKEESVRDEVDKFFSTNAVLNTRMAKLPSVVGLWRHNVAGGTTNIVIYPNGKFKSLQGGETWELDGLNLRLRWPVNGGIWIDDLILNSEMRHYEGRNQQGILITGDKVDDLEQSFFDFVLKPC